MRKLKISEFKTHCIRILKSVATSREPIVITHRGKPLVQVDPLPPADSKRVLGGLLGVMEIRGDIIHSDFADDWEASGLEPPP